MYRASVVGVKKTTRYTQCQYVCHLYKIFFVFFYLKVLYTLLMFFYLITNINKKNFKFWLIITINYQIFRQINSIFLTFLIII